MLERLNTTSTVNVETFGAVGDGSTDDTTAIQSAFDYAKDSGGGLVQFTPGKTYAVSTFLVVYDNTTIYAYGATIKAIGNTGLLRNFVSTEAFNAYQGHSNITVLGGVWDGNAFNGTDGSVTAETDVMNFIHASNVTLRDLTVQNTSTAHAVEFNSSQNCQVLNCNFLGYKDNSSDQSRQFSEAVQLDIAVSGSSSIGAFDNTTAQNILVDGCYFGPSARCGKFGRAIGSHTLASGAYYYGIQITNNRIEGTIQEGIRGYGWRRVTIANNVINSTGLSGICLTIPNPSGGYSANSRNISITGNTIERPAADSGIRVLGYSGATVDQVVITGNSILGNAADTANGIHVEYCSRPVVTGNTVYSMGSTGIYNNYSDGGSINGNTVRSSKSNGININQSTGTTVSGNNVDTTTTNHCIFVGSSNDFLITGNRTTNAAGAGIRLGASATDGMVTNNRIIKGTSVNGITGDSTATGSTVALNDLTGNGWSAATAVSLSGSATYTFSGGTTSPGDNLVS
ncbi:right-handed parallel beta-helix repeat-containing protein [Streptomyces sp. NPDC014864]|uniref:right-handed parallel beta-helix repeat-containing protein n=1 Tax=Streptomyces sp. NPDC014864 TaxID=3364924 RepID=UPI0036F7F492